MNYYLQITQSINQSCHVINTTQGHVFRCLVLADQMSETQRNEVLFMHLKHQILTFERLEAAKVFARKITGMTDLIFKVHS